MCLRRKLNKFLKLSKKLLTIQNGSGIIIKLSARTTRNSTDSIGSESNLKINEKGDTGIFVDTAGNGIDGC